MKIVVFVKKLMFYRIIFLLLMLVVSPILQFSSQCPLFSVVHKHRLQEYSKFQAYQTLFKVTHPYKIIKDKK